MKMFIINIIIMVLLLWYCGVIKISLHPFSVSFPGWHVCLGIFLITMGARLFAFGQYRIGYEEGNDAAMNTFKRVLEERSEAQKLEITDEI